MPNNTTNTSSADETRSAHTRTQVRVHRMGGNWVWTHDADARGLCEEEQLPYWVQSKAQVREFVRGRYESRGLVWIGRVSWA